MNKVSVPAAPRKVRGPRPKATHEVRYRAPSRPGRPAILDIVTTLGSKVTQSSYFLTAVPVDFGRAGYLLEKFTIDLRGDGDETYSAHVDDAGLVTCTCAGHTFHGHCKHADAVRDLRATGQLACLHTPAEQEHERFFGDTSDLADEAAHAAEQARLLDARAAALERHADAVTDDDVPF
jgi:hypothetical protein